MKTENTYMKRMKKGWMAGKFNKKWKNRKERQFSRMHPTDIAQLICDSQLDNFVRTSA